MPNICGFCTTFLLSSYKIQCKALKSINLDMKSRWNNIFIFDTSSHKHQNCLAWDAWMSENVLGHVLFKLCFKNINDWIRCQHIRLGHNNCQKVWNSQMDFQDHFGATNGYAFRNFKGYITWNTIEIFLGMPKIHVTLQLLVIRSLLFQGVV